MLRSTHGARLTIDCLGKANDLVQQSVSSASTIIGWRFFGQGEAKVYDKVSSPEFGRLYCPPPYNSPFRGSIRVCYQHVTIQTIKVNFSRDQGSHNLCVFSHSLMRRRRLPSFAQLSRATALFTILRPAEDALRGQPNYQSETVATLAHTLSDVNRVRPTLATPLLLI